MTLILFRGGTGIHLRACSDTVPKPMVTIGVDRLLLRSHPACGAATEGVRTYRGSARLACRPKHTVAASNRRTACTRSKSSPPIQVVGAAERYESRLRKAAPNRTIPAPAAYWTDQEVSS